MKINIPNAKCSVEIVWKDGGEDVLSFASHQAARDYIRRARSSPEIKNIEMKTIGEVKC